MTTHILNQTNQRPCITPGPKEYKPNRDTTPYWDDFINGLNPLLWLPDGTEETTSLINNSWFPISQTNAPENLERIFPKDSIPLLDEYSACSSTDTQAIRIRFYPTKEQKLTLKLWTDAARWCFNKAVELLKDPAIPANWKSIKTQIIHSVPERLKPVPYQVKSIAVRDACKAVSETKKRNKLLKEDKANGLRLDEEWHKTRFRSRKNPRQGCFIPKQAINQYGAYHTILGKLQMAEPLPINHQDSRITVQYGQYHLCATHPAQTKKAETQGLIAALDPGIRSFLTWFSEINTGHIAHGAFGRIQRLCNHLDKLLARAKLEKRRFAKRNKYKAADRMRLDLRNLIDELHHKAARFLVDNFDVILLPTFETSNMVLRGRRKLRAKSVRALLGYAHHRFQKFLCWKAWQHGKEVILVNEAYTSKTCSWSGEIIQNFGGRKVIIGSDGVWLDRDTNSARGILLRASGDTPALRTTVEGRIGDKRC